MRTGTLAVVLGIGLLAAVHEAKLMMADDLRSMKKNLVVMDMNAFPSTEIALHMPCNESNMFATKCMVIKGFDTHRLLVDSMLMTLSALF